MPITLLLASAGWAVSLSTSPIQDLASAGTWWFFYWSAPKSSKCQNFLRVIFGRPVKKHSVYGISSFIKLLFHSLMSAKTLLMIAFILDFEAMSGNWANPHLSTHPSWSLLFHYDMTLYFHQVVSKYPPPFIPKKFQNGLQFVILWSNSKLRVSLFLASFFGKNTQLCLLFLWQCLSPYCFQIFPKPNSYMV